jgi:hypothetical protein
MKMPLRSLGRVLLYVVIVAALVCLVMFLDFWGSAY